MLSEILEPSTSVSTCKLVISVVFKLMASIAGGICRTGTVCAPSIALMKVVFPHPERPATMSVNTTPLPFPFLRKACVTTFLLEIYLYAQPFKLIFREFLETTFKHFVVETLWRNKDAVRKLRKITGIVAVGTFMEPHKVLQRLQAKFSMVLQRGNSRLLAARYLALKTDKFDSE